MISVKVDCILLFTNLINSHTTILNVSYNKDYNTKANSGQQITLKK